MYEYTGEIESVFVRTCFLYVKEDAKSYDYKYYIYGIKGIPDTCFRTEAELNKWMQDRGMKFNSENPKSMDGRFKEIMLMISREDFEKKYGHLEKTKILDNGDYTACYIDRSEKVTKLYFLNCNIREREVFKR